MYVKYVIMVIVLLASMLKPGDAEFLYNRIMPKTLEELEALGLKCVPGRTVIKIESKADKHGNDSESEPDSGEIATDTRRIHTRFEPKDDSCKICVCSVEGKDEYCSKRPAMNVNECIRMTALTEHFKQNLPFEHERSLSFRIRRDYLWHKDEIPYSASSLCYRGVSYYTNNIKPNSTSLANQFRLSSQLDYPTRNFCYFCVCHTSGEFPKCISRSNWFCDYYRIIRRPNYARDRYRYLFKEDRPAYFRQLSYRIRRTMSDGLMELLDKVGQSETECVPFLSEYTDCSEANICTGCNRCTCTVEGTWSCQTVNECPGAGDDDVIDADTISNAYEVLFNELSNTENTKVATLAKSPIESKGSRLLEKFEVAEDQPVPIVKRSLSENFHDNAMEHNGTIKFYHTLDEINEDTLKNTNASGTIEAKQVLGVKNPKISRRTSVIDTKNITGINDLHIDFNQPKLYDHHIVDNKIDALVRHDDKISLLGSGKINDVLGNYSQVSKDIDLSKLIVNELKKGYEVIGDNQTAPVSNITFTPENDTLTAMAFIAGNLLSKLWKIEKDSSVESTETEVIKHEKLADLLELFKEPLTMRQELIIKNALNKLSKALNKDNKIKNISLCQTLASSEDLLENLNSSNNDEVKDIHTNCKGNHSKQQDANNKTENNTVEAISKVKGVINLINTFENVRKQLSILKHDMQSLEDISNKESIDLQLGGKSKNVFGNLLEKIIKIILPKKSKKRKTLSTKVKHMNLFGNSVDIKKELKEIIGINTDNLTITSKDKLVIDYLNIFKINPESVLRGVPLKDINMFPSAKSDVSKLLKINSMNDLIEIIAPKSHPVNTRNESFTNNKDIEDITTIEPNLKLKTYDNEEDKKIKIAKDKLRRDLSVILGDLIELHQNGDALKDSNDSIVNILPCLYNFLNAGKGELAEITKLPREQSFKNVIAIFESLKNNLEKVRRPLSRRSDIGVMPKSSEVWGRIIKNLNRRSMMSTRRSNDKNVPKSFYKIKKMIENVDLSSNSYDEYLKLGNVPVASHLILLKVVEASVKQIENTLENIKLFMETVINISAEEELELQKFVHNAVQSVKINSKILEKLKAHKNEMQTEDRSNLRVDQVPKYKPPTQLPKYNSMRHLLAEPYEEQKYLPFDHFKSVIATNDKLKLPAHNVDVKDHYNNQQLKHLTEMQEHDVKDSNTFKLTRNQILVQLIKNRLQLYIRMKESKRTKLNHDVNYNLAKRIMTQLESGNYSLANELFAVFMVNADSDDNSPTSYFQAPALLNTDIYKDPVTNIENLRTGVELQPSDNLLKQLQALKAMDQ